MMETEANKASVSNPNAKQIMEKVICFLLLFACETIVKRTLCLVLIAGGVPNERITELTGVCDRSIRTYKKEVEAENIENLLKISVKGRKGKLDDYKTDIIEEINKNNYHSKQQIVDMVFEKFGIKTSITGVGRLLKKTGSDV